MPTLSFNQKVGLGFAVIILLMLTSGLSSLWNLNDISGSTTRVNETAVPVVKESNNVQIQLLKLAKLSTLAFNASDQERIIDYEQRFEGGVKTFDEQYKLLEMLATDDADMNSLVIGIKGNYDLYRQSVASMFEAKLKVLESRDSMLTEADKLLDLVDAVGGALVEIQYYMAPEIHQDSMELVVGSANQADINALAILKTIDEIKITQDLNRLEDGMGDFRFSFDDSKRWYQKAADIFAEFDDQDLVPVADGAYADLGAYFEIEPSIVDFKKQELEQAGIATLKLGEADAAVSSAVESLDELLSSADDQFSLLQSEVFGNLDFGFKSSIVMLIVLILLAAQNFNSMRLAIQKKMIDLAKLNRIGRTLAAAQSQSSALEEVLQSMHEKMGVAQGSVYLTNDVQKLEVKAHFPPKAVDPNFTPAQFGLGEGIIGKAAESKKVIFVPNTSKDKSFVSAENDTPRALLCVPLVDKDLLVGVINLSGDVKNVSFADSDYEYVSSVARSLVTTIKNIRMREVIEDQNRNLEAKVEERTSELRQKNNDIANMMANMHQGLFTITAGGLIHQEYAAFLEQIFETDRIADRNFADLLFTNTTLGSDAVDQNITAVDAIVGEDEMMYDFNSHCLATEMIITFDGGKEKIIEMDWDPIISEAGEVDKLMVTVRDVTELKALEAEAEGQKQELEIIGEILAVDAGKFGEFLRTSKAFISRCRSVIEGTKDRNLDAIAELFRNIHTVKGNARTYGLKYVTNVVHEIESSYDALRKDDESKWQPQVLLTELTVAEDLVERYGYVFKEKLGRDSEQPQGLGLDPERVASWLDSIKHLTRTDMNSNVKGVVAEAYNMLITVDSKPLSEVIADVSSSSASLADQLGKPKPNIVIDDSNIVLDGSAHSMLNNIFMHVFRNALDHGIEGLEERESKGKPSQGNIRVDTSLGEGFVTFEVKDDGRGIAISKIYDMAVEKGIYDAGAIKPSAKEIANLIFSSGFSTAEELTDVSGRGVGMDAVKGFLEQEGGSIEIALGDGDDSDDFRSFRTSIRLPSKFYSTIMSFPKSA